MEEFHVEFRHVEPDIVPIDFEGVHFILQGPLAWFYKFIATNASEERAQNELWPLLIVERQKAVDAAKQFTASSSN